MAFFIKNKDMRRNYIAEVIENNSDQARCLLSDNGIDTNGLSNSLLILKTMQVVKDRPEIFAKLMYLHPERPLFEEVIATHQASQLPKELPSTPVVMMPDKPISERGEGKIHEVKEMPKELPKEKREVGKEQREKGEEEGEKKSFWKKHASCTEESVTLSWATIIPTAIIFIFTMVIIATRKT